jgi:hypothetical protein
LLEKNVFISLKIPLSTSYTSRKVLLENSVKQRLNTNEAIMNNFNILKKKILKEKDFIILIN